MKRIVCNVNLFAFQSPVYIINDNDKMEPIVSATMEELPEVIAELAHTHGISDIKLAGCQAYAHSLADQITAAAAATYSNNNLNIEIL